MDVHASRHHHHHSSHKGHARGDGGHGKPPAHGEAPVVGASSARAAGISLAGAIELKAGPDGTIVLPAGVSLDDVLVQGRDIVVTGPGGTVYVIHDGAVYVPQLVVEGVAVPPMNLAALLNPEGPQPAAGPVSSSGGNFADPVGDIQPGYDIGNLLPYTELSFPQVQVQEIFPRINNKPDVTIKDGGPASHDTVDQVSESGLPALRASGTLESPGTTAGNGANVTDGTILVESPDGIASLTVNGVLLTGVAGQQIVGQFGTLTLGSLSNGQISYTYTLTDNTNGDTTSDVFVVVVTDPDGDTSTARLTVSIVDDVPTAYANVNAVSEGGTVSGNLLTDGTHDVFGADGAGVTSPTGGITGIRAGSDTATPVTDGTTVVTTALGTLTLNANGSYSYVAKPNVVSDGTLVDHFVYTIRDGDGDLSTTTLDITVGNVTVTATDSDALVNEAGLASGSTPAATSEIYNGSIVGSGGTGPYTYALTGSASGSYGTLTLNADGTYTYTLTKAYTTSPAANNGTETEAGKDSFGYTVTDAHGNSTSGTIVVSIVDDVPTAAINTGNLSVSLDESTGLQADSNDVSGPLAVFGGVTNVGHDPDTGNNPVGYALSTSSVAGNVVTSTGTVFGADGGTAAFSLSTVNGTSSGLLTTAGDAILLYNEGGIIVGRVGSQAGAAAFAVAINSATGAVSVVEYLSIQHNLDGANRDDSVSIAQSAISAVVTATDGDGDISTASASIGNLISFQDSAPILTSVNNINIQNSGDYAASGAFAYDLGADGAPTNNNVFTAINGSATVNGNAVQNFSISETAAETATSASFAFSFDYANGTGTAHETGTLTFNKVNGTYTVDLTDPIQAFSVVGTAGAPASAFVNYNADGTTSQGPSNIATVALTSNLFVQFTGDNGTISTTVAPGTSYSPTTGTFAGLDLFSGSAASVTVSSSAAGVAGNTIQGGEVLDFNLYSTDPHGTTGGVPTGSSTSMFIELDGVGTTEDMIVILKLFDTSTHQYTTQALLVQNGDIITSNATLAGTAYAGIALDNNDGLIVIEANDYQQGNSNLVIVGAQIAGSDAGISGTALDFNGALGVSGASSGTQPFSTDVNDNPFKIQNIGFVTTTTTNQTANLSFTVTIQDGDGDKISQAIAATVTSSADSSTPVSLTSAVTSVVPIVIDLNHNGAEFLGNEAGISYNYGHGMVSTAWAGSSDGLLAIDLNHDGKVSSADEFVFGGGGLTDLQGLAAQYDTNHDGMLDARDANFAQFGVWQDANANGIADAGEFHSLTDLGITAISLTSNGVAYSAAGGDVQVAGTATVFYSDGSTTTAADASFAIARLSQQVENAVTASAAGSLVTASLAGLVLTDGTETAPVTAPVAAMTVSADSDASVAPATDQPTVQADPQPTLADAGDQPLASSSHVGHTDAVPSHVGALSDGLPDQAAPVAQEAVSGEAAAHFAAAIVFDTPAVTQAMDALLAGHPAVPGPAAQADAPAVGAVVEQALADSHGAGIVDKLIDSVLAHQTAPNFSGASGGDAGAPHSVDLAALLSVQVGPPVHAAAVPAPIFDFNHAGAELLAATHA